jgi:hypothetical protein
VAKQTSYTKFVAVFRVSKIDAQGFGFWPADLQGSH